MHPGRDGPELRGASGLRGTGLDREEQAVCGDAAAANALDAGSERGRHPGGGAAGPVRGAGPAGGAWQAAGRAQDPALRIGAGAVPPSDGILDTSAQYVGAPGRSNWLEEWTFFGLESDCDMREKDD